MKRLFGLLSAAIICLSATAQAHGPTRQKVEERISIDAPPSEVWAVVGDFGGWADWLAAVESIEVDGDTRVLNLGKDLTVTEQLRKRNDDKMLLSYKITDMSEIENFEFNGLPVSRKVLPVDNYSSVIQVEAEGEGSVVTWIGKFYRGYLLNPPTPEGLSDEAAIEAVTNLYEAGLGALKTLVEEK